MGEMTQAPHPRHVLLAPFSCGGLVLGLVFFGFSLTPTLLPRPWTWQGLVSGVSLAIGYGLGALIWFGLAKAVAWRPAARGRRGRPAVTAGAGRGHTATAIRTTVSAASTRLAAVRTQITQVSGGRSRCAARAARTRWAR